MRRQSDGDLSASDAISRPISQIGSTAPPPPPLLLGVVPPPPLLLPEASATAARVSSIPAPQVLVVQ